MKLIDIENDLQTFVNIVFNYVLKNCKKNIVKGFYGLSVLDNRYRIDRNP